MDIYVTRDGKESGPYSAQEILQRLADGRLKSSDYAWHEGENEWIPLYMVDAVNQTSSGKELAVIELTPVPCAPTLPPSRIDAVACPFCAEPIKPEALKCKHCGEMLDPRLRAAQQAQQMPPLAPDPVPPPAVVIHNNIGYGYVPMLHDFPHFMHLLGTIFTAGLWLPVWILHYLFRDRHYYH